MTLRFEENSDGSTGVKRNRQVLGYIHKDPDYWYVFYPIQGVFLTKKDHQEIYKYMEEHLGC